MNPSSDSVTQLLIDWSRGDKAALDKLMPLVYDELHRLASHYLRHERSDHTLQPTALVHEAYLRLVDQTSVHWQDRAHFFGMAATLMRHILVDYARHQQRAKRGGSTRTLALEHVVEEFETRHIDLIALDEALIGLAAVDAQQSRVVELRFFGGLTIEEIAQVLSLSLRTVHRDWRTAKAWLYGRLHQGGRHDA
jgi:RNA polymerase sigma factor (TIGR02999 family)